MLGKYPSSHLSVEPITDNFELIYLHFFSDRQPYRIRELCFLFLEGSSTPSVPSPSIDRIRTRPLSSGIPPSCMSSGVLAEIKWANYSLGLPSVRPERLRIQMRKRKTRCPGRVFEFSLLPKPLFSTPTPSPSSDTRDSNPRYKL